MISTALSHWDPKKKPAQSSLKNTPDATPESSLKGGQLFKKRTPSGALLQDAKAVAWTQFSNDLAAVLDTRHQRLPKNHQCTQIDARDENSPDDWIPRHPDLVRLTGKHPFNCEPPIGQLLDQGFFTPISLHYVRNHGKAPKLHWHSHTISIGGLVENPLTFTMDQLVQLPSVTLPVTLVCAGNRRKEENMIKQTIGFSWGCAAHACNLWTGVRLSHLLELAGVDKTRARHVCFTGVAKEGLPNGTYGTSIDIATALDPYGEVLIAYEQNHTKLHPDHGFPVRVVIPGWIGGRMVKWLDSIEVTDKPSENFYHFFDNRILPPHVDAELAKSEGWWYKPEYLFNQLNINSAIVYPANGERLQLMGAGVYTIKGYAYSGGGRKVTRVEISLDGGKTWSLCKLDYPEERYSHAPKYGKYYCWMFWEYTIDNFMFLSIATGAGELRCRAWDEASNTQPKDITWNLMGMGNNCHFTVKVIPKQIAGGFALEFLHPTVPGPASGGWMPPPSKPMANGVTSSAPPVKSGSAPSLSTMVKLFSMKDVEKHNSEDSAWIVVDGRVYDTTPYLEDHPGGKASILMNAGQDATEEFLAIHSDKAKSLLEEYYIGDLVQEKANGASHPLHLSKSSAQLMKDDLPIQNIDTMDKSTHRSGLVALDPKKWMEFELIEKKDVSHDTRLFKFKLPTPEHRLGLPVGYHMFVKSQIDDKLVMRAYTPVSSDDDFGSFTLCIKVYFAGVHPKFPEGGKMSQYMEGMEIGDMLKVKGPLGHFEYLGKGRFVVNDKERAASKIGLICGGTGLTPAFQVMKAVYKDVDDDTEVFLLYANRTEKDILMREELEKMASERDNIHVWYTLDKPDSSWEYSSGFISEKMIRSHIPAPGDDSFVGMCGPPPMINFACIPNLEKIGFAKDDYMQF